MKIILCNNNNDNIIIIPFITPKETIILLIVYPIEKPLNIIVPYPIGIPIIVDAPNHNKTTIIILEITDSFNSPNMFTFSVNLILLNKLVK